jgi:hypothetical protein
LSPELKSYAKDDARPAFWMNLVKGAESYRLRAQRGANAPTFVLRNAEDFLLQQSWPLSGTRIDRAESRKL